MNLCKHCGLRGGDGGVRSDRLSQKQKPCQGPGGWGSKAGSALLKNLVRVWKELVPQWRNFLLPEKEVKGCQVAETADVLYEASHL